MKYILPVLARFIALRLNPANELREVPPDELLQQWLSKIAVWCNEASLELLHMPAAGADALYFPSYIEHYQHLLVHSMDILYADKFNNNNDPLKGLREESLVRLDKLYQKLGDSYAPYFNAAEKLPDWRLDRAHYQFRYRVKKLRKALMEQKATEQLIGIALQPFYSFSSNNSDASNQCSRYLQYLRNMADRLQELINKESDDVNAALEQLLLIINYNQPEFIYYYYERLTSGAHTAGNILQELEQLYACTNQVNRIISPYSMAYLPSSPSVKELASEWLAQEIAVLEKRLKLDNIKEPGPPDNTDKNDACFQHLGVSVDLYSYHKRIEYEAGMLINKNQTQMIKSIAENCRRRDLQPVAVHSFRMSYYTPEQSTKKELQQYYKKMLLLAGSV